MFKGFTAPFIAELALVFPAVLAFVAVSFAVGLDFSMQYLGQYRDRWFVSPQV